MYVLYLRDLAYRIPYTMRVPVHTVWMSVHTVWVYVVPCFHVLSPVRGVFSCCFCVLLGCRLSLTDYTASTLCSLNSGLSGTLPGKCIGHIMLQPFSHSPLLVVWPAVSGLETGFSRLRKKHHKDPTRQ